MDERFSPLLQGQGRAAVRPPFRYGQEDREAILNALRQALEDQPHVAFAYVHGSFLADRPFHDIDVAVYLDFQATDERNVDLYAQELAFDLEERLRVLLGGEQDVAQGSAAPSQSTTSPSFPPVDVRALNQAPLGFCYQVCRGHLLVSQDETQRVAWVVRVVSRYLDRRPLHRRALKEAMTTCH
ncbi:MAG: nucleotidyltransferase domain-containing protein [Anaerolineae bacterium]